MSLLPTLRFALPALLLLPALRPSTAEPIPVQYPQGTIRGFLVIRTEAGAPIGYGELNQTVQGERVTSHLVYRFRDGSLDDETAVFTQNRVFQLISDHHIQRGPFFSKPLDILVQSNGEVTTRTLEKDGSEKSETTHIDLPPDLSNGIIGTLILNISPKSPGLKLGMVVPVGKGRLIHLAVSPSGEGSFSCVSGDRCKAAIFEIKPELGGVVGVIAPIIGKQPDNIYLWVLEGTAPAFVREVGQLAEGGPVVSIELAGAVFHHATPARTSSSSDTPQKPRASR